MAEQEEEKRRVGVPKYYYWAKKAPKPKAPTRMVNSQQRKFYLVMMAFRTAKVTAILLAFLMFFGKI